MRSRMIRSFARSAAGIAVTLVLSGCTAFGYPVGSASGPGAVGPERSPVGPGESYEIGGRRYHVMRSAEGYRAVGLASWYGPGFDGRPTSTGETYDQDGMTAAHRTLPLGTWVEVTNLTNGRSVEVRINDRGPFEDPHLRIIDLSRAAARELDIVESGTAHVEVRALTGR